jgi:hypothetical protein
VAPHIAVPITAEFSTRTAGGGTIAGTPVTVTQADNGIWVDVVREVPRSFDSREPEQELREWLRRSIWLKEVQACSFNFFIGYEKPIVLVLSMKVKK